MSLAEQILVIVFLSCLFSLLVALMQAERDAALAEVERLREDATRNRWCEEMKANIYFLPLSNCWSVSTVIGQNYRVVILSDRNAAIDAAMKGGK